MIKFTVFDYMKHYKIKEYPAVSSKFDILLDSSIKPYFNSRLLSNPDRGFRGELKITLGTMEEYPNEKLTAYDALNMYYKKYREENVHLYQLYVYLTRYCKTHITDEALTQLTDYFKKLEQLNIRVLLRFAYETELTKECPTTRHILENMDILKKWFCDNKELINKTVYAMQLGTIGLWGEGHSSSRRLNKKKIVEKTFDIIPDDMILTMRHPKYISLVPEKYEKRAALHDDFLVGFAHPWGMIPHNHKSWQPLLNKCKHTFNDGEMPWGRDKTVPVIDAVDFVCQCRDYALSTLSIEHNYKEDAGNYHLEQWKNIFMTKDELDKHHLPYISNSLIDEKISVFDYLNCYLGFVPSVGNLKQNSQNTEFDIYNFGLGTAVNYRMIAKCDDKEILLSDDLSKMCQFTRTHFSVPACKSLQIRIERKNQKNLTYCLANQIEYANGWNRIF